MPFSSVNPATDEVIATYAEHGPADVENVLARADAAQKEWGRRSRAERAEIIRRLGEVLREGATRAGRIITAEMGKPLGQAVSEVVKCATACSVMADYADDVLRDRVVASEFRSSVVRSEPMGLILSIMPWNFPFWQFFRFAAPALIAGNGVLLKHAPTTFGSALEAVRLCREAGLPDGLVDVLFIDVPAVEDVIADKRIRAVTFTGSTRGGMAVGALAGRYVKKSVLELGGSDAYVVLEDADLDHAVRTCVESRCINSGQSCIAAKRFIVHEGIASIFTERMIQLMRERVVGDPLDASTQIGPMARRDLRDALLDQISRAVAAGAVASDDPLRGLPGRGFFIRPLVLSDVAGNNPVAQEELFGPVAMVMTFSTDDEALRIANGTSFGLGAAVFTKDSRRADLFTRELHAGNVFVNDFVRSDARFPFGGVKDSGYGRELGIEGLHEFVAVKTVVEV